MRTPQYASGLRTSVNLMKTRETGPSTPPLGDVEQASASKAPGSGRASEARPESGGARGKLKHVSPRRPGDRDKIIFFGPLIIVLVVLLAFPIGFALYASFADVDNSFSLSFVGFDNYQALLADTEALRKPLLNTLRFVSVSVIGALALGLVGALVMNAPIRGRRALRTMLLFPWVIPTVLVALLWRWIMDANLGGALNGMLQQFGLIDGPISWLGDPSLAPWIVIFAQVWHGFPFVMVMVLAALQTIPEELYEASSLDGAGAWQRFRAITWPGIRPVFVLVGTLEGLYAFREFATIRVLTDGGPAGSTEVLATLVYRYFFEYHMFGKAVALAALMFILALAVTILFTRFARNSED